VNTRLLGTLALIASPMMLIGGLLFDMTARDPGSEIFGLIFVLGWMCSLASLGLLKATGRGLGGKIVLIIEAVGLVLAVGNQIYGILGAADESSPLFIATDIAWPLSVTFMIVVGIASIRAGVLPGWQRYTPLLCGLAFPLLMLCILLVGQQVGGLIFAAYMLVSWGLLAYVVRSANQPHTITSFATA